MNRLLKAKPKADLRLLLLRQSMLDNVRPALCGATFLGSIF